MEFSDFSQSSGWYLELGNLMIGYNSICSYIDFKKERHLEIKMTDYHVSLPCDM